MVFLGGMSHPIAIHLDGQPPRFQRGDVPGLAGNGLGYVACSAVSAQTTHVGDIALTLSWDLLQWPAMAVTIVAAWLVASSSEAKRGWGFWLFLLSNVLWVGWALFAHAYALLALQVCLAFMNIRGAKKNS
jgi:hypothetical protein